MKLYIKYVVVSMFLVFACTAGAQPLLDVGKQNAIKKIEDFLNGLGSYEASFEQVAYDASVRQGKLYILKPNRVRLEYLKPNAEVLLVDQDFVTHYLPDLDELNFMPNDGVPISFLSKSNINLRNDFKILAVKEANGKVELVVELKYKEQKSVLSVLFSGEPFEISRISVLDGDGNDISMKILSSRSNIQISPKLFEIKRKDDKE